MCSVEVVSPKPNKCVALIYNVGLGSRSSRKLLRTDWTFSCIYLKPNKNKILFERRNGTAAGPTKQEGKWDVLSLFWAHTFIFKVRSSNLTTRYLEWAFQLPEATLHPGRHFFVRVFRNYISFRKLITFFCSCCVTLWRILKFTKIGIKKMQNFNDVVQQLVIYVLCNNNFTNL